jgi:hypothetical protein
LRKTKCATLGIDDDLQFLVIVIQERVPLLLLEDAKADALDLRSIRAAVIALRHHVVGEAVAALVLIVLLALLDVVLRLLIGNLCFAFGSVASRRDVMMMLFLAL